MCVLLLGGLGGQCVAGLRGRGLVAQLLQVLGDDVEGQRDEALRADARHCKKPRKRTSHVC